MKLIVKQLFQSLSVGLMLPSLLLSAGGAVSNQAEPAPIEPTSFQEPVQPAKEVWIPVIKKNGRIVAMELESYISRVVLGEMPASFDEEALKAQAVAARTYTLQCIEDGERHNGAVCMDYQCCQTYMDPEEYVGNRGTQKHVEKVFAAVQQTAGQVLTYKGDLICATYFASAGGVTEDAREVWGEGYPYLISVESPETSIYDGEKVYVTSEEFQKKLSVTLSGSPKTWFGPMTYTLGEGVDSVWIGNKKYSGLELRKIFGLRSTVFTITADLNGVAFQTTGYGHRVGLSQHGANALADQGYNYRQILAHYYRGTVLELYTPH